MRFIRVLTAWENNVLYVGFNGEKKYQKNYKCNLFKNDLFMLCIWGEKLIVSCLNLIGFDYWKI